MTAYPSEADILQAVSETKFRGHVKITIEAYNDASGYLRNSTLNALKRSREYCRHQLDRGSDVSKALSFGTALHTRILTPEDWDSTIAVQPAVDGRTKAGKEAIEAFLSDSVGKTIIKSDEFDAIREMEKRLRDNPLFTDLMTNTEKELSAFFGWSDTPCKARFDAIGNGRIIDLKSTEDCSIKGFQSSLATYGYHRQAAFYLEAAKLCGIDANEFIFVAIEKKPPYEFSIYKLDAGSIEKGREEIEWLLLDWQQANGENEWKSSGREIEPISLPAWAW